MKLLTEFERERKVTKEDNYYIVVVYDSTRPKIDRFIEFGWIDKIWDKKKFMSMMPNHYQFSHVKHCETKEEYERLKWN